MAGGLAAAAGGAAALAGGPVGMAAMAGLQVAMSVAQMIKARQQKREAEEMQRNTVTPTYKVNQLHYDNLAWAESQSSQGLSDAAMTAYQNNMDRTVTTSIDAILRGGGSVNTIADLADTAFDQSERLALLEDQIRLDKNKMRIGIAEKVAAEEDKEWQINTFAPYQNRLQAIAALRSTASENANAGRNMLFSAVGNYVMGNKLQPEIDNVYGRTGGPSAGGTSASFSRVPMPIATMPRQSFEQPIQRRVPTGYMNYGQIRSNFNPPIEEWQIRY